jgi:hypothetical protein
MYYLEVEFSEVRVCGNGYGNRGGAKRHHVMTNLSLGDLDVDRQRFPTPRRRSSSTTAGELDLVRPAASRRARAPYHAQRVDGLALP